MRQFPWRKDGMKQVFDSPHKTWNKQAVALMIGNVMDSGYVSFYVRPSTETLCNGHVFPEGCLQHSDLAQFGPVPESVRAFAESMHESFVLMRINTRDRRKARHIHGWIAYVTNSDDRCLRVLRSWEGGAHTNKSASLVRWMIDALTRREA